MSTPTELAERSMELLAGAHSEIVENLPDGWTDSPDDTAGLFQTALFAECMSFSLAIRECLSERLVGPANALGRTLTDLAMMLVYMAQDPSRAQQLTIQYWWKETNREIELTKSGSEIAQRRGAISWLNSGSFCHTRAPTNRGVLHGEHRSIVPRETTSRARAARTRNRL